MKRLSRLMVVLALLFSGCSNTEVDNEVTETSEVTASETGYVSYSLGDIG